MSEKQHKVYADIYMNPTPAARSAEPSTPQSTQYTMSWPRNHKTLVPKPQPPIPKPEILRSLTLKPQP